MPPSEADAADEQQLAAPGEGAGGGGRRRFVHTTEEQRRCVVEWLEQPPNFQLMARGAAPVRTAEGRKLKKADGFRALMRYVNARTGANWDVETTRSRYESLLLTYSKARRSIEHPDFGLSDADLARGLVDPTQKRNALCLFYDRLTVLHRTGGRALAAAAGDNNCGDENAPLPVTTAVRRESFEATAATVDPKVETMAAVAKDALVAGVHDDAAYTPLEGVATADDVVSPLPKRPRCSSGNGVELASRRSSVEPKGRISLGPASRLGSMDTESVSSTPDSKRSFGYNAVDNHSAIADVGAALTNESLEAQRLVLLREQVRLQKRELDLREREFAAQSVLRKQTLRAELATKLVAAGKSLEEIRGFLELLDT